MGKKRRHDEKKPFSIQHHFMHKAKPWKSETLTAAKSEGSLNKIIRRLKCYNASSMFETKANGRSQRLNNTHPKYPFLTRNLEKSFNSWSSFEQKCQEYASYKENSKPSNSVEVDSAAPQPIIEFPPEDEDKNELFNNENLDDSFKGPESSINGLTRWKNTMELIMPSSIAATSQNRQFIGDCSFESVQSLPFASPIAKVQRKSSQNVKEQSPFSTTMPTSDRLNDVFLQSTPAFLANLNSKSRKRQFHSTPKI